MTGTSISCIGRSSRIGRSSGSRRIAVRILSACSLWSLPEFWSALQSEIFSGSGVGVIFRYRCRRIHRIVGIHKPISCFSLFICASVCAATTGFQITGLSVRYCYFHIINGIVIMSVFQLSRLLGNAVSVYARNSIFHCRKFCFSPHL